MLTSNNVLRFTGKGGSFRNLCMGVLCPRRIYFPEKTGE